MEIYNTRRQRTNSHIIQPSSQPEPSKNSRDRTDASFLRRHIPLLSIITLLIASTGLFLIFVSWQDGKRMDRQYAEHQAQIKEHYAVIAAAKAAKIVLAKEAETTARGNQVFDENKYFSSLPTKNPGCDVKVPISVTVVVNKKHCFANKTWQPTDLTTIGDVQLQKEAAGALTTMMGEAEQAGVGFELVSGYRSYDEQQALYESGDELGDAEIDKDLVSSRAGYSEHQTGLAVDLKVQDCALDCFGGTRRYEWLKANAASYGFIERYPSSLGEITGYIHEPWHWRYVGTKTALDMKKQGIETLEMYFGVSGGDYYEN